MITTQPLDKIDHNRRYQFLSIEEEILKSLRNLGVNSDEVASNLSRFGFVGLRGQPNDCPLANYLREKLKYLSPRSVEVVDREVVVYFDSGRSPDKAYTVQTPEPCLDFEHKFDDGLYSDLEAIKESE